MQQIWCSAAADAEQCDRPAVDRPARGRQAVLLPAHHEPVLAPRLAAGPLQVGAVHHLLLVASVSACCPCDPCMSNGALPGHTCEGHCSCLPASPTSSPSYGCWRCYRCSMRPSSWVACCARCPAFCGERRMGPGLGWMLLHWRLRGLGRFAAEWPAFSAVCAQSRLVAHKLALNHLGSPAQLQSFLCHCVQRAQGGVVRQWHLPGTQAVRGGEYTAPCIAICLASMLRHPMHHAEASIYSTMHQSCARLSADGFFASWRWGWRR